MNPRQGGSGVSLSAGQTRFTEEAIIDHKDAFALSNDGQPLFFRDGAFILNSQYYASSDEYRICP